MGGLKKASADHLLDVSDRRARDRRRAAVVRLLQQGRDPLPDVHASGPPAAALGHRHGDVAADRHLHVPARVPGVSWRPSVALHPPAHPEEEEPARTRGRAKPHSAHAAAHHDAHGHAHAPHDAPPAMALPLIVLAIGSIFAGYVGVPHALGGSNRIERFLEPSFEVSERSRGADAALPRRRRRRPVRTVAMQDRSRPRPRRSTRRVGRSTELMLMALSSGVAIAGIAHRGLLLAQKPPARRRDGAPDARILRAARCTSTTSTSSTTRRSCSRSSCCPPGPLEGRRCRRDRRGGQRRGPDGRAGRAVRCGACRPDRCAPMRRRCFSASC